MGGLELKHVLLCLPCWNSLIRRIQNEGILRLRSLQFDYQVRAGQFEVGA